jgi:hypothetical protein
MIDSIKVGVVANNDIRYFVFHLDSLVEELETVYANVKYSTQGRKIDPKLSFRSQNVMDGDLFKTTRKRSNHHVIM